MVALSEFSAAVGVSADEVWNHADMLACSSADSDSANVGFWNEVCLLCGSCDNISDRVSNSVNNSDNEVGMRVEAEHVVAVKMDSACSRCMSGVKNRIRTTDVHSTKARNIEISGFNGSSSRVDAVGENSDGKIEYYVSSMPENLVLLSAHAYAQDGAVVLLKDGGGVYKLKDVELKQLHQCLDKFEPIMELVVENRTYEVRSDVKSVSSEVEQAVAHAASTYFNTKVNVSNVEERIMVYLMSGLTLENMFHYLQLSCVRGIHPEITTSALNNFKRKWGSTPDVYQLANPRKEGNRKGYMSKAKKITRVGEYIEIDFFECDYNEKPDSSKSVSVEHQNKLQKPPKAKKLSTHGGGIAMVVAIDVRSGHVWGEIVQSTAQPLDIVERCVQHFELAHHKVEEIAADSGVVSESMFQVFVPAVSSYLLSKGIKQRRGEPRNHSNGTEHVENLIFTLKSRIRMAMKYCLGNPNFKLLGFTVEQVLRLYGEVCVQVI